MNDGEKFKIHDVSLYHLVMTELKLGLTSQIFAATTSFVANGLTDEAMPLTLLILPENSQNLFINR